jgi:DNA-binding NtrC family response regulator
LSKKIEVMVVDDEPIVCERVKDFLEKKGILTETYKDSQSALDRIQEKTFDVIVTDVKMEGASGIDLLSKVKNDKHRSEVIIITGYSPFESYLEAEAIGVADYILKPFKMDYLYQRIKKAAKKAQKTKNS